MPPERMELFQACLRHADRPLPYPPLKGRAIIIGPSGTSRVRPAKGALDNSPALHVGQQEDSRVTCYRLSST
jgi:hypothetical protein